MSSSARSSLESDAFAQAAAAARHERFLLSNTPLYLQAGSSSYNTYIDNDRDTDPYTSQSSLFRQLDDDLLLSASDADQAAVDDEEAGDQLDLQGMLALNKLNVNRLSEGIDTLQTDDNHYYDQTTVTVDSVLAALEEEPEEPTTTAAAAPPLPLPVHSSILSVEELESMIMANRQQQQQTQTTADTERQEKAKGPVQSVLLSSSAAVGSISSVVTGTNNTSTISSTGTVAVPFSFSSFSSSPSSSSSSSSCYYLPLPSRQLNWMTRSEVALIIKLGLNQLQQTSTDPAADNFYAQVMELRKGKPISQYLTQQTPIWRQRQQTGDEASTSHTHAHTPDGQIKLPDGTLGKVVVSSLRKPKKLMDLQITDQAGEQTNTVRTTTQRA